MFDFWWFYTVKGLKDKSRTCLISVSVCLNVFDAVIQTESLQSEWEDPVFDETEANVFTDRPKGSLFV